MDTPTTTYANDAVTLLHDLEALFGRRARKILEECGGTAAGVIDGARHRRGAAWDKVRAALALKERALLEAAAERSYLTSPAETKEFLIRRLGNRPFESFVVVFLTVRHGVIAVKELFRGTLDGASVHPREVVREALEFNAAAVVLGHVHPSGNPSPSQADELITRRLRDTLSLLEIRVLDHLIVSANSSYSFAEHGLL